VSNCINQHAEVFRDVFVNHTGKKKLVVKTASVFNWNHLLELMNQRIDENVKSDLGLEPTFTTTTRVTQSVAALTKMASFKKYFTYGWVMCCGIPTVDLTGTLEDWLQLREKVSKVTKLITSQDHMVNWSKHVMALLDRLIQTYQVGNGILPNRLQQFWSRIVTFVPYGSGSQRYISGWCKVLLPGNQYDQFPEHCHVQEEWDVLAADPPAGEAELNDHGLEYDLYCMSGFVGMQIVDGFVQPQLGYTVHAVKKELVS
jgi:hypothetical protein